MSDSARNAWRQGKVSVDPARGVVVPVGTEQARTKMASAEIKVTLKNGAELRRLMELLIDAGVLTQAEYGSESFVKAKERLQHELGDLGWLKRLVSIE